MKYYFYLWMIRYHYHKGSEADFFQDQKSSNYHQNMLEHYKKRLLKYIEDLV